MGLDKWLKPEDTGKQSRGKINSSIDGIEKKSEVEVNKNLEKPIKKLKKYMLTCPNAKCKYQKIVMKNQLTEKDKVCPRCHKAMKIKER